MVATSTAAAWRGSSAPLLTSDASEGPTPGSGNAGSAVRAERTGVSKWPKLAKTKKLETEPETDDLGPLWPLGEKDCCSRATARLTMIRGPASSRVAPRRSSWGDRGACQAPCGLAHSVALPAAGVPACASGGPLARAATRVRKPQRVKGPRRLASGASSRPPHCALAANAVRQRWSDPGLRALGPPQAGSGGLACSALRAVAASPTGGSSDSGQASSSASATHAQPSHTQPLDRPTASTSGQGPEAQPRRAFSRKLLSHQTAGDIGEALLTEDGLEPGWGGLSEAVSAGQSGPSQRISDLQHGCSGGCCVALIARHIHTSTPPHPTL
jgi:hypothetical protein